MEFVDTHCHIHFNDYANAESAINDAKSAGVTRLICVGCTLGDSHAAANFAKAHKSVWFSAGVHPHDSSNFLATKDAPAQLNRLLQEPKAVAIGEIGLDYYRQNSPKNEQAKCLRAQIEIGLSTKLPFIFHVRDGWQDFWPIIDEYKVKNAVLHSFSAGPKQLDEALTRGFYVSLNGIMTFTKEASQLQAAREIPNDKLLLETDAPFLTPVPFRGERCEPKHVRSTAEFLANLRAESLESLALNTTVNALKLFSLRNA